MTSRNNEKSTLEQSVAAGTPPPVAATLPPVTESVVTAATQPENPTAPQSNVLAKAGRRFVVRRGGVNGKLEPLMNANSRDEARTRLDREVCEGANGDIDLYEYVGTIRAKRVAEMVNTLESESVDVLSVPSADGKPGDAIG